MSGIKVATIGRRVQVAKGEMVCPRKLGSAAARTNVQSVIYWTSTSYEGRELRLARFSRPRPKGRKGKINKSRGEG